MNALELKCIIEYVAEMTGIEPRQMVISCEDYWNWSILAGGKIINWDSDHITDFDEFVEYYEKEYLHIDK